MMLSKFNHGITHFRNGTLVNHVQHRLQFKWRRYITPKRIEWWNAQTDYKKIMDLQIQPGVKMRLYRDSDLCRLIYRGRFEYSERKFLNAFLRPGDTYIDIGANIGLFSLIAAKLVGKTGKVYAFEPSGQTYQRLLENVNLNCFTHIDCYQLALSDQVSDLNMTTSLDGFDAWNSLGKPTAGSDFATETVKATTWSLFAQENNLVGHVTMMKIDVEGWESYVLSGATEILSRPDAPVLQVEFTEKNCKAANSSCEALYHQLIKLGYQLFTYDPKSKSLVPEALRARYPYLNLIATKKPEQVRARLQQGKQPRWMR